MATNKRLIKSNDEAAGGASFNTVLYTGNGSTQSITGVGFQPDFVWIKQRNGTASHSLQDSVRGAGQNFNLYSDNTAYEGQYGIYGYLSSFDINGFTVNAASGSHTNASGTDYVAWCWKAAGFSNTFNVIENGTLTTSSTASGAGISTSGSNGTLQKASVNRDIGFSICVNSFGSVYPEWASHGLGEIPDLVINKPLNTNEGWLVNIGPGIIDSNNWALTLNNTNAAGVNSRQMTSTVVPLTYTPQTQTFVSYAFKSVPGFSKFGSWNNIGPVGTINMGFEPAMVIIKKVDGTDNWRMYDNKRDTSGINNNELYPNLSNAEYTLTNFATFTSTGLDFTGGNPFFQTGQFIYMAFADQF